MIQDLDELYDIYSDGDVVKYIEGLYDSREDEEEFTRTYIREMYGFYEYGIWVVTKKNGEVIGRAGISNRNIDDKTELEVGYVIGKKYQRRGYAQEAVNAITEYAFEKLEAERLNCFIRPDNIPSQRLAEKLGFTKSMMIADAESEYIRYIKYPDN